LIVDSPWLIVGKLERQEGIRNRELGIVGKPIVDSREVGKTVRRTQEERSKKELGIRNWEEWEC